MQYINLILFVLSILLLPKIILTLQMNIRWIKIFGSAFWCYIIGLLLSLSPLVSSHTQQIANIIMKISIPLALPLFIFARASIQKDEHTKDIFKSLLYLTIAIFITSVCVGMIFNIYLEKSPYYTAMMAATYLGGTINMASLHQMFHLPAHDFILLNSIDTITGGVYLLLLLSFMPKVFGLVLKRNCSDHRLTVNIDNISLHPKKIFPLIGLTLSIGIFSYIPTMVFPNYWESIIFFSLLSILAFFVSQKIDSASSHQSHYLGHYLMMIFCICLGTEIHIGIFSHVSWKLLLLVLSILLGTILLHLLLAKIFKVDRDIFIISHTAGIFGPAFIAPVASVIKRNDLLLSGIAAAVIGNICGNYLGLLVYQFIKV